MTSLQKVELLNVFYFSSIFIKQNFAIFYVFLSSIRIWAILQGKYQLYRVGVPVPNSQDPLSFHAQDLDPDPDISIADPKPFMYY